MKIFPYSVVIFAVICSSFAADWSYTDTSAWSSSYTDCAKSSQSPVDIITTAVELDPELGEFKHYFFDAKPDGLTLSNNGHAVVVSVENGYTINDKSVLPADYKLVQYHLHWGSSATVMGSEHMVDGKQYYGELHAVFYNTAYADFDTALTKSGGLAVLGFFIEPSYPQDNLAFNRIFLDSISSVDNKGESLDLNTVNKIASLATLLPCDIGTFYRYNGSLTTPGCYESVIWTVFENPIRISTNQANTLSTGMKVGDSSSAILNANFRPVQKLNGRVIKKNSASAITPTALGITLQLLVLWNMICK